ncbi:MAG: metallophosphoesterase [Balneolaceae bacterium]
MISRKEFLKKSVIMAAGSSVSLSLGSRFFENNSTPDITILYTNDTHARLDPFPGNATEFSGLGGIARRAALVNDIRSAQKNVLLLDAGDVFQGTPWFDVYGGEADLNLMTEMGYDAMAVGNHEFDRGPDGFAEAAKKAGFPILAANYHVQNTPMNPYVSRMITREFSGFKIGVFGLGIQFDGVIDPSLTGDVKHRDPAIWANGMVNSLRNYHKCDYIICLSHLGYQYSDSRIDDLKLASTVGGMDLIIGGHTHTFLDIPSEVVNPEGKRTIITQAGHSGVRLGRIDLFLEEEGDKVKTESQYYTIGESLSG